MKKLLCLVLAAMMPVSYTHLVYAGAFRRLGQFPQARAERFGVLRHLHAGGALRLRLGGGRGRGGGFLLCRARQAAGGLVHAQFAQAGKAAAQPVQAPMLQIERHRRVATDGGQRSAQALSLIHI